jgi:hypothetical protein
MPITIWMWLGQPKVNIWTFRSKYEWEQATRLVANDIFFAYENEQISFLDDVYNSVCLSCGGTDVGSQRVYNPDFYFPATQVYVETKGRFDEKSRRKMKNVCMQSEKDIRIVFMYDNYLTKKKSMRYTRWCELNDIQCAVGDIPLEWGYQ